MVSRIRTLLLVMLAVAPGMPALSNAETHGSTGAVFVMTNAASGNEIIAYGRNADGSLEQGRRFSTGGRGSGGTTDPLASQGSLTLTEDRSFLLAVNAGSGSVSVFRVQGARLSLVDRVPCGGAEPVAVAQHGNLVYVLNAGGTSNVVGFRFERNGRIKAISNSIKFLTSGNSGPGSLSFSPDGQFLLVTEKLNNRIDAFHVQLDGTLGPIAVTAGVGPGTFAVLFAPNGAALVSETGPAGGNNASAISSYAVVRQRDTLSHQRQRTDSRCGHLLAGGHPDGRFVYTSNSATSTISGFAIGTDGALTPLPGTIAATLPTGSTNLDTAISSDGKFLYTLDSGTGSVSIFGINEDGSLTSLGDVGGLSAAAGFNGIAAN